MSPSFSSPKCSLAMVVYDPAAAQLRAGKRERQEEVVEASASSSSRDGKRARQEEKAEATASSSNASLASAVDPHAAAVAPPVAAFDVEPINAEPPRQQPLPAAREVPPCLREHFLSALGLRPDLPVHFICEKVMTRTDVDGQQNRFRIPIEGVEHCLRAILTPDELEAANLLHDLAPRPKHKPTKKKPTGDAAAEDGKEGKKEPKKKGKVHGGLPVKLVDLNAGVKELQMSRWDSNGASILKGQGYADFIRRCSFREHDALEIWAFMQRPVRIFGVDLQHGDGVLHVLVVNKNQQPQRCCYCPVPHAH